MEPGGPEAAALITGAREASTTSWLQQLAARAMGRQLTAFVVPGMEIARAHGVDLGATGLRIVDNPRHASVLVVVGGLPEGLREAAAVVYAQMMRPRAVLAADAGDLSPLPEADASTDLDQAAVADGVAGLSRAFAEGAFGPETVNFDAEVIRDDEGEDAGGASHGHMHHGFAEETDGNGGDDEPAYEIPEPVPGEDFMSMVEMTQEMPASGDGLKMEWVEAPYGPLFPGLPGGLDLTLTLDGDTVAQAETEPGIEGWTPAENLTGTIENFPDRVARIDPLSPVAYRLLALRALEDAADTYPEGRTVLTRVGSLERERAASHLGWLADFGHLIGDGWLSRSAGELQIALLRVTDTGEIERLRVGIGKFVRRVERAPLLRSRLGGTGSLDLAAAAGPVARAGGVDTDVRTGEPVYRNLGFVTAIREGNDALARLRVRLEEIDRSLDLVVTAGSMGVPERLTNPTGSATGAASGVATIETPRGAATLRIMLEGGTVRAAELDTPSTKNMDLIGVLTEGKEVGDALVGVASLDLSPWEVVR
jgi:Ni,Fe-hydrogenase III large subunit